MRKSRIVIPLVSLLTGVAATVLPRHTGSEITYFNNRTVFQSPPDYTVPGTLYARTVQLADGSILATWENYSPEPPAVSFPIYRSVDYGASWTEISRVYDTSGNGFGMRYQPHIYQLPRKFANFEKGTIFVSGSSIPTDLSSTDLQVYASADNGLSWSFVSSIAKGGEAIPNNGLTPVWEPFLMLYEDTLIAYYSDQRDNATHGQKLVHQTTTDGYTWGPVVDDVAYANYTDRPGMPIVSQLTVKGKGKGKGPYIYTYEWGGGAVDGVLPVNYTFPVYYKIADDPTKFGEVDGLPIIAGPERIVPEGSPYNVWSEEDETIIVSCGSKYSQVFVNKKHGDEGAWEVRETGERVSYTRSLNIIHDEGKASALLIAGGGKLPPSTGNEVTVGVVDLKEF